MALLEPQRAPTPLKIRPLHTLGACLLSSALFVIGVAVTARLTADGSLAPPHPDTAPTANLVDAGGDPLVDSEPSDAGVMVGVSNDAGGPELTGPPTVAGPPFDANDVATAAVVIVEVCAVEALRWDPSLGGPFSLFINLPVGAPPTIEVTDLTSPVLASCLHRRSVGMTLPSSLHAQALEMPLGVAARASLDAAGIVTWSDAVVVSGRTP